LSDRRVWSPRVEECYSHCNKTAKFDVERARPTVWNIHWSPPRTQNTPRRATTSRDGIPRQLRASPVTAAVESINMEGEEPAPPEVKTPIAISRDCLLRVVTAAPHPRAGGASVPLGEVLKHPGWAEAVAASPLKDHFLTAM